MFILLNMKDTIRIQPNDLTSLDYDLMGTLRSELNAKFTNKVIPEQGLVIAVHSILSHDSPTLFAGDGGAYVRAVFRLVVFKPFEAEVLVGRIHQSDEKGIYIRTDFFHNIFVPKENLPVPNRYVDNVWIWDCNELEYYFDIGARVHFRVTKVKFTPFNAKLAAVGGDSISSPEARAHQHGYLLTEGDQLPANVLPAAPAATLSPAPATYVAPMEVVGSMSENGLGDVQWW